MRFDLLILVIVLFALCGCGHNEPSRSAELNLASVTGTVSYQARMALPPGALIEISLQDVSLADAPARILVTQLIENPGPVPVSFELTYDPREIEKHRSYSLSARISNHGQLLFINDTHTPVITRDAGNHADIILVRVQ